MSGCRVHFLTQFFHRGITRDVDAAEYEILFRMLCNYSGADVLRGCLRSGLAMIGEFGRFVGMEVVSPAAAVEMATPGEDRVVTWMRFAVTEDRHSPAKRQLLGCLLERLTQPGSLKSSARRALVQALGGKIPIRVQQLNLPASLAEYLIDFEQD